MQTGIIGTILLGWKVQDWNMQDQGRFKYMSS